MVTILVICGDYAQYSPHSPGTGHVSGQDAENCVQDPADTAEIKTQELAKKPAIDAFAHIFSAEYA